MPLPSRAVLPLSISALLGLLGFYWFVSRKKEQNGEKEEEKDDSKLEQSSDIRESSKKVQFTFENDQSSKRTAKSDDQDREREHKAEEPTTSVVSSKPVISEKLQSETNDMLHALQSDSTHMEAVLAAQGSALVCETVELATCGGGDAPVKVMKVDEKAKDHRSESPVVNGALSDEDSLDSVGAVCSSDSNPEGPRDVDEMPASPAMNNNGRSDGSEKSVGSSVLADKSESVVVTTVAGSEAPAVNSNGLLDDASCDSDQVETELVVEDQKPEGNAADTPDQSAMVEGEQMSRSWGDEVEQEEERAASSTGTHNSSGSPQSPFSEGGEGHQNGGEPALGERVRIEQFEFEFPSDLCGRLIGMRGRNINMLKDRSGAEIIIKPHPMTPDLQLVAVEGSDYGIKTVLRLIRNKFPTNQYPHVSLRPFVMPTPAHPLVLPDMMQLGLPEGSAPCEVIVSSIVTADRMFVQQPAHPSFPNLEPLGAAMLACYASNMVPQLPRPVDVGVICAAPMLGGWYRAQVVNTDPAADTCDVKFVDYGGFACLNASDLRQIRADFMTLPFQAVEVYLAHVRPLQGEEEYSAESISYLEEITRGFMLQATVVSTSPEDVPTVDITNISFSPPLYVNYELACRGVVRWAEEVMEEMGEAQENGFSGDGCDEPHEFLDPEHPRDEQEEEVVV